MPKVSVLMGVYNCKNINLLNKSINSIINQTFKDWELIICNDGSTNDLLDELKRIEKKDKRIKVLSYDNNRGLHYALNQCLKEAKGMYIARQDDDDYSMPERFEKQVKFLEDNQQYSIVGTIADVYDDNGIWREYHVDEKPTKYSFYWNSPFMHPTIMGRKEVFDECDGYRVSKETRRCEDYDLFMRMYSKGYKGYNIQEKLYLYRFVNDPRKKYRPMKYRFDEAIVRFKGYRLMNTLGIKSFFYILKPIFIGLIPQKIVYNLKNREK